MPNRLTAPFIEFGKDMRTLTAAAIRDSSCGIPIEWLENINRLASTYAKRQASMAAEFCARHRIEQGIYLSRREKEVFGELSHGLTRTEIAEKMGISPNTLKMVVNNLYTKIGAGNLAEAIRIGMEKNLI